MDEPVETAVPRLKAEASEQPILRGLPDVHLELLGTEVLDDRLGVMEYKPAG